MLRRNLILTGIFNISCSLYRNTEYIFDFYYYYEYKSLYSPLLTHHVIDLLSKTFEIKCSEGNF